MLLTTWGTSPFWSLLHQTFFLTTFLQSQAAAEPMGFIISWLSQLLQPYTLMLWGPFLQPVFSRISAQAALLLFTFFALLPAALVLKPGVIALITDERHRPGSAPPSPSSRRDPGPTPSSQPSVHKHARLRLPTAARLLLLPPAFWLCSVLSWGGLSGWELGGVEGMVLMGLSRSLALGWDAEVQSSGGSSSACLQDFQHGSNSSPSLLAGGRFRMGPRFFSKQSSPASCLRKASSSAWLLPSEKPDLSTASVSKHPGK